MIPDHLLPVRDEGAASDHLRLLADANLLGIVTVTEAGIVEANDAFLATIGCTRGDVDAVIDWRALTPPEHAGRDVLALEELQVRGACTPFEKEYWRKDGSRVPVRIGAVLLDREPMRWLCLVQDLSAEKQVERDLRQAAAASEMSNRAKDDFVNMLVHEIRQPLAAISMATLLVKTALQHESVAERLRRPLEVLENQTASLTRLTDELLLASKIVRGAMPMRQQPVDFAALVRDLVGDERIRAEAASLTLLLDVPDASVIVTGDPMRLRHVVANLVGNSIKYTPPGGGIRVTLVAGDELCELRVQDTGRGIDRADLPHVFEPFRRASGEGSGFGLGLAVVRSIVEQHRGSASIASDGPNLGTEVAITLPVSHARPAGD